MLKYITVRQTSDRMKHFKDVYKRQFLERAWAWKTKYGNRIVSQLKKLGSSCDLSLIHI